MIYHLRSLSLLRGAICKSWMFQRIIWLDVFHPQDQKGCQSPPSYKTQELDSAVKATRISSQQRNTYIISTAQLQLNIYVNNCLNNSCFILRAKTNNIGFCEILSFFKKISPCDLTSLSFLFFAFFKKNQWPWPARVSYVVLVFSPLVGSLFLLFGSLSCWKYFITDGISFLLNLLLCHCLKNTYRVHYNNCWSRGQIKKERLGYTSSTLLLWLAAGKIVLCEANIYIYICNIRFLY